MPKDGEDEDSIRRHIQLLKSEYGKANPDASFLKRTIHHRRTLVGNASSCKEVLQVYPAISDSTIVSQFQNLATIPNKSKWNTPSESVPQVPVIRLIYVKRSEHSGE